MDTDTKVLFHSSVLAGEIIDFLDIKPEGVYVDMTLGDGGHSILVLERLTSNGRLFAFDKDSKAIHRAEKRIFEVFRPVDKKFNLINSDFAEVKEALLEFEVKQVDGFIFDLGVSSAQLDEAQRGFSFSKSARLDMRMDTNNKIDAHYVVNNYSFLELLAIIREYGEEDRFAKKIARSIERAREEKEIGTTLELADIIYNCIPRQFHPKKIHPATKTFQALRIEVNKELDAVDRGVKDAISLLKSGGRICVITFNSLEDRIVKRIFKEGATGCVCPKQVIYCQCGKTPYLRLVTKKPLTPSEIEIKDNPRARSAKLRVAERI